MKKAFIIIAAILAVSAIIALVFVYIYVINPNKNIEKYRDDLVVEDAVNINKKEDAIHFLKTGSSDAILIESDGHFALIDCAEDSDNPRGFDELVYKGYEQEVLDYLKKNASVDGKVYLDFVLGTHSQSDHIGGFDTVINDEDVTIGVAYLKEYDEARIKQSEIDDWDNKEVYEQMVEALNNKGVEIISHVEDPVVQLGNFTITIMNTDYEGETERVGENENSFGVLVELNGARIFLAGDINNYTGDEDKLKDEIGKIDVLKVGHHSYSGSTTVPWLKTLDPDVCVVTNDYEKTDKSTLRRITRISKSPILTTGGENGVKIVIESDGSISYYRNIC